MTGDAQDVTAALDLFSHAVIVRASQRTKYEDTGSYAALFLSRFVPNPLEMRKPLRVNSSSLLIVPVALAITACVQESPTSVNLQHANQPSAAVIIEPPPGEGPSCTYTQGYWKNHPELWDDAGDGMVFLTTDQFYNSGVSNLTILRMPPKGGNAYEILAHQFIAASLNLNGATSGVSEVDNAMSGAAAYFAGEPAGIPSPVNPMRAQLVDWSSTLDRFNNGLIGPGHCS